MSLFTVNITLPWIHQYRNQFRSSFLFWFFFVIDSLSVNQCACVLCFAEAHDATLYVDFHMTVHARLIFMIFFFFFSRALVALSYNLHTFICKKNEMKQQQKSALNNFCATIIIITKNKRRNPMSLLVS